MGAGPKAHLTILWRLMTTKAVRAIQTRTTVIFPLIPQAASHIFSLSGLRR